MITGVLAFIIPSYCLAGSPVHGAKAAGMGTAFVAVADDPSAILYNPAGLIQISGTNFYSGGSLVFPSTRYTAPSGNSEETEFQVFFPPNVYAVSDFGCDHMSFGLGIYSPFGIGGTKWSESGLTRYVSTDNLIETLAVNPVVAWKVKPWLSLGAGFYYQYASTEAERMINQAALGASDGKFSLEGAGGGWGFNAGLLLFPGQRFSFGVSYRSRCHVGQDMTVTLGGLAPLIRPPSGNSSFESAAGASIDFPQVVSVGVAFRPTAKWTIAFDADWPGWPSLKTIDVSVENKLPSVGLTDFSIPFDYKDAWMLKAGFEYKFTPNLAVRGGYLFTQADVPSITLGPANPDADQNGVTVGLGYKIGKYTLNAFYLADFYEPRSVSNDILEGRYRNFMQIFGMSINFKWK